MRSLPFGPSTFLLDHGRSGLLGLLRKADAAKYWPRSPRLERDGGIDSTPEAGNTLFDSSAPAPWHLALLATFRVVHESLLTEKLLFSSRENERLVAINTR